MSDASTPPAPATVKPGWQTSEFWLKIVAFALSCLFASGTLTSSTALNIAGIAAALLGSLGYTVSRTIIKTAAAVVLVALVAHTQAACGPSSREKTISATLTATNAAAAGFVAFDAKHQHYLVAAAPDRAHGEAELAAWRAHQLELEHYIEAAYRAIAAAALADDDPSVVSMLAAAAQLTEAMKALGVSP